MAQFYSVAFRQEAERHFGARQATEVARQAAAAARRQLVSRPLQSHPAYEHIALHFREVPDKPSHGVFLPEYRQAEELTKLLLRAIDRSGTEPMLSKSIDNDWAAVIQTWLGDGNPIGYCGTGADREELTYLCVVARLNGDLVTAYPVNSYRLPGQGV